MSKEINKDEMESEAFEPYGLEWQNTSIYDDDTYGAGHWKCHTHKIVPLFYDGYCEYDIYEIIGLTIKEDMGESVQHESPKLVYSGSIDLMDRDYIYKLFVNLGIVIEPDYDDDDFELAL